jgi:hypothetical protein
VYKPILTTVSHDEFAELTRPLIGLPISLCWRGYGSALFLEVGPLTKVYSSGRKKAELGISIGDNWRIEGRRSLLLGSSSGNRKIENGILALTKHRILEISIIGRLPEIYVELSGNKWMHTFASSEGQPEWAVHLNDCSWLAVERGQLVRGRTDIKNRRVRAK